jgi:eukaryotic-like serine/threonine-protein kinase
VHDLGVIDGRFAVERACGSGGMGSVYRAVDRSSGQPVAVKVLHDSNPQLRVRFDREARTLATLTHPSIVRYIAHGTTGADLHYLVMEWLDGETLKVRLERAGLTADESVHMAATVADALAAAHEHGVIHRDVKPSNLLFAAGDPEQIKLIDFGVVRATAETVRLTEAGASVGTPGYMAPEQVRSVRDVDARADLFALGCVLYECLSGRRAFAGADSIEVWIKIVLAQPTSLRVLAPGLPEPLVALVEKLLAKEPADRPAGAAEVAAALRALGPIDAGPRRFVREDELPTMAAGKPLMTGSGSGVAGNEDRTRTEAQRSVFLVVATDSRSDARGGDGGSAVTTAAGERRRAEIGTELDALASRHGGRADFLAEGSVVITLEAAESTAVTACAAGECALALRSMLPTALIAVTAGSGPTGSPILDDVIARGLRLIEAAALEAVTGDAHAGEGVQLDEATARLLADVFHVVPTLTGYQLRSAA